MASSSESSAVGEVVGLQLLDEVENAGVFDSLYFSFVLSEHVSAGAGRSLRTGKPMDLMCFRLCVNIREMPHNVIEARSKVVNDLPGENAESAEERCASCDTSIASSENLVILDQ